MKRAILLSGGLDSTAIAYWSTPSLAISIDYGQTAAEAELRASRYICDFLKLPHRVLTVDLKVLGSGPMAETAQLEFAPSEEWWPFRNQLLITLAGGMAIREGIEELILGTVKSDVEHSDGTDAFIQCADKLMRMQEGHIQVSAPALQMSTTELIRHSGIPISVLGWCHSCNVSNTPCLRCRACKKQICALQEVGFFST